jgi:hypothetical protein
LPARALSRSNRAIGRGVFYTCYYAVMAAGPAIAGLLRDICGTASAALYLGGGLLLAIPPLLAAFHALKAPSLFPRELRSDLWDGGERSGRAARHSIPSELRRNIGFGPRHVRNDAQSVERGEAHVR